ncbi:uncharacterized protein LOC21385361 [Morus notabilis]|uniref:uncharacterized protein LOC21385361 n=1 Tax=Morus notabilis TaxID=981085 RepID=UPI000CED58DD|nr:uncharacterized protein LOC21385361 [Morus notabilis]XP_024031430.1 uncharacterized protein LOC21385361 [Morus notabilis]
MGTRSGSSDGGHPYSSSCFRFGVLDIQIGHRETATEEKSALMNPLAGTKRGVWCITERWIDVVDNGAEGRKIKFCWLNVSKKKKKKKINWMDLKSIDFRNL